MRKIQKRAKAYALERCIEMMTEMQVKEKELQYPHLVGVLKAVLMREDKPPKEILTEARRMIEAFDYVRKNSESSLHCLTDMDK